MILEEFFHETSGSYTYLVSSERTSEAALIDPVEAQSASYLARLAERNLKLAYTLETRRDAPLKSAGTYLKQVAGSRRVAPQGASMPADVFMAEGDTLALGELTIRATRCATSVPGQTTYRIGDCFFRGGDVVVVAGSAGVRVASQDERDSRSAASEPTSGPDEAAAQEEPRRLSPEELAEQTADEARRSLEVLALTPKEIRVLEAYLSFLGEGSDRYPSADELSEKLETITKRDLHVQIHNIRRKQQEGGCLPVVLRGQITKWLRDIQAAPEYTSHELEFLSVYFDLQSDLGRPPTGDEAVAALDGRPLQWVRKRVQTIRAKQIAYGLAPLLMARRGGGVSRSRTR